MEQWSAPGQSDKSWTVQVDPERLAPMGMAPVVWSQVGYLKKKTSLHYTIKVCDFNGEKVTSNPKNRLHSVLFSTG